MPVLQLLILAAWTLLVVRLFAWRATLRNRTFATYLILGAFLGITAVGLSQRLLTPYGETQPFPYWLAAVGRQAVLLAPVLLAVFWRPSSRETRIADAFLLAFMVGFGYDLAGALLAASVSASPLRGFAWLPPWQFRSAQGYFYAGGFSYKGWAAGSGYWTALVALVLAIAVRCSEPLDRLKTKFGLPRALNVPIALGVIAFLWVVAEQTGLLPLSAAGVFAFFRRIVFAGRFTAWLTLLLFAAASLMEIRWTKAPGAETPRSWAGTVRAAAGEWRACAAGLVRLVRPIRLGPEARLPLAVWAVFAVLFFIVPRLPAKAGVWWWATPLMRLPLPFVGLTVFNAAVVVLLLRWYLAAAPMPRASESPDMSARAAAEQAMLHGALGVIVLVSLYSPAAVYPFFSVATFATGAPLPSLNAVQIGTFLLLLAAMASSLSVERAMEWQRAPLAERRVAAMRRWRAIAAAFVVAWGSILVYIPILTQLHAHLGPAFYAIGRAIGLPGNFLLAMLAAALTGAFAWGLVRFVQSFGRFDDSEASQRGVPRVVGWLAGVP